VVKLTFAVGRGRDNTMYGQEQFIPGEATLKGGIVSLGEPFFFLAGAPFVEGLLVYNPI
jgi:hypothetical protein